MSVAVNVDPQTTLPGIFGLARGDRVRVRRCAAVDGPYEVTWAMDAPVVIDGECRVRVVGCGFVDVGLVVKFPQPEGQKGAGACTAG